MGWSVFRNTHHFRSTNQIKDSQSWKSQIYTHIHTHFSRSNDHKSSFTISMKHLSSTHFINTEFFYTLFKWEGVPFFNGMTEGWLQVKTNDFYNHPSIHETRQGCTRTKLIDYWSLSLLGTHNVSHVLKMQPHKLAMDENIQALNKVWARIKIFISYVMRAPINFKLLTRLQVCPQSTCVNFCRM